MCVVLKIGFIGRRVHGCYETTEARPPAGHKSDASYEKFILHTQFFYYQIYIKLIIKYLNKETML